MGKREWERQIHEINFQTGVKGCWTKKNSTKILGTGKKKDS